MEVKPFRAIYPKLDLIASPESFFGTVKYQFKEYYKSGFFDKDDKEAYYIYTIKTPRREYTGLLGAVAIRNYDDGHVVKHEKTVAAKEQKTIHLILQREALIKPVLLTHKENTELTELLNKLSSDRKKFYSVYFEESQTTHSFVQISDAESFKTIENIFKDDVIRTYIADGHHRFSASSLLHRSKTKFDFTHILAAIFPFNELEILDHNRSVQVLNEISPGALMAKLSKIFDIEILEAGRKPLRKHEITMLVQSEWFSLNWKQSILDEYKDEDVVLDADLLNKYVMVQMLSIKDVSSDIRINYVTGKNGVEAMRKNVEKSDHKIGFILFPISIEEMIIISDKNMTLPPKSTWFEPRIVNGLISQII